MTVSDVRVHGHRARHRHRTRARCRRVGDRRGASWHPQAGRRARSRRSEAKTIRVRNGKTLITDGPFTEPRSGSPATTCSNATASTRPSSTPRVIRWPAADASKCARSHGLGRLRQWNTCCSSHPTRIRMRLTSNRARSSPGSKRASAAASESSATGFARPRTRRPCAFVTARLLVTDGPFAESKEWVVGFDIIECDNLDDAIDFASRHPMARAGRSEIRPFWPAPV